MSIIKQKYLRDENGETFSPITSASSVITNNRGNIESVVNVLPYTYRIPVNTTYVESCVLFDGNIKEWSMIKGYFKLTSMSNTSDNKALYIVLNNENASGLALIDNRFLNTEFSYYNPVSTSKIFMGDIPYKNNTTYLKFEIVKSNDTSLWFTFQSELPVTTINSGQFSQSKCTGQFKHNTLNQYINNIKLEHIRTLQCSGILQIYP